ncbi:MULTISPECIES: hypothetical protein [unclassified Bradyrhizobium]
MTVKNRIPLDNYYLPGDLERQIRAFVVERGRFVLGPAQLLFDIRYVLQMKPRFGPKVEDYRKVRGRPASKRCRYPGSALEFAKVAEAQLR